MLKATAVPGSRIPQEYEQLRQGFWLSAIEIRREIQIYAAE